ncbi:hypothetical protein AB9F45_39975, partial [Rhizobium leguminosarum]
MHVLSGRLELVLDCDQFFDLGPGDSLYFESRRDHSWVIAAVKDQIDRFTHTCHQVVHYESYVNLAERLNALLPGDF